MKKKVLMFVIVVFICSVTIFAGNGNGGSNGNTNENEQTVGGEDQTTIVVEAHDLDFIFALEANTGSGWVNANNEKIYNSSWDVRSAIEADLRVRATQGSYDEPTGITVKVTIGNLYLDAVTDTTFSNYYDAGQGLVHFAYVGNKFTAGSFNYALGELQITTKSNYLYGKTNNKDKDSLYFTIRYNGDENAPSGRYESNITLQYSIS